MAPTAGLVITRFAPTPSGYLHLGNAVNAVLVSWLTRQHRGRLILRVDDMDAPRCRDEYVDDVFDLMAWLAIGWDGGPADAADLWRRFSMRLRTEHYRAELEAARDRGLELYACSCSRSRISGPATGGCPGGCRTADLPLAVGRTALRAHVPVGTTITVGEQSIRVDETVGDIVMWRRDDLPAYHLVSVLEDRDASITHVVRGQDLLASTAVQMFLAPYLEAHAFTRASFVHHDLVTSADGTKLSKSQLGVGSPLPRTEEQRQRVLQAAATIGAPLGITPPL